PDGSAFSSIGFGNGDSFYDPEYSGPLDATGQWKIEINPAGADTGTVTVLLKTVSDVSGTITVGGTTKTVTIAQAGQNALYTFSGTNGQSVTTTLTAASFAPNGLYYVT